MLLALLALAWSNNAWSSVTINVKADQKPYIYAWYGDNKYLGNFPGTQLSNQKTYADETWYYVDLNVSEVNIIVSFGSSDSQSSTINLNGDRFIRFTSNNARDVTDYVNYPNGVNDENDNYVYLVNVDGWSNVYAYVYNGSNENHAWPGEKMTKVGTNSKGFDVYKWTGTNPSSPATIIFNNGSNANQSANLDWDNGGIWSNYDFSYHEKVNGVVLDVDHFPDASMREALTNVTGVQENGLIATRNQTVLDLSNKGIEDVTGIENFTNLEELYLNNNDLQYLKLTNNSKLEILEIKKNTTLKGFTANASTVETNHAIIMPPSSNKAPLKRLDATGCTSFSWFQAISGTYGINTLEWLSLKDCPLDGWSTGITAQTGLKYLDVSNTGQKTSNGTPTVDVTALTQLETLIVADNYASGNKLGSVNGLASLNSLKYFDMSGCDGNPHGIVSTFTDTQKGVLEYLDISNQHMTTTGADPAVNSFTVLKTFKCNTQATWTKELTVKNCPVLEEVDVTDNAAMTGLTIDNCPSINKVVVTNNTSLPLLSITNSNLSVLPEITDLATTTALTKIDLTGNEFSAVPTVNSTTVNTMVMNSNKLTGINVPSNIQYLYAQDNQFASDYSLPETSLVGLDLGNNGFTKFTAKIDNAIADEWAIDYTLTPPVTIQSNANESDGSNTMLQALHLGGNPNLETVIVNGYKGLTKLASGNDMTTTEGKGLYVKDNTALKTLDISNNRIEILGQGGSLSGLSGLETLNASHNKIMTLTNKTAITGSSNPRSAYGAGKYDASTCPNIEDLTGLKELNLSYNLLSDSIHLWKNTALERLDVSHNRTITKRNAGETQYYRNTEDGTFAPWHHAAWKTEADQFTGDLNDTIGLRMLDLYKNVNLKYLDISFTNIENTAEDWTFVNNRVGPENLEPTTTLGRWSVPRFVLVNHCPELVEFHSNYNAMKSLGVGRAPTSTSVCEVTGCPKLEVLEARECRGQDDKIMQGEITISVHNPLIRYYDVSNSDFDKVNPYTVNGNEVSGQNLETLIIDGNYTRDNSEHWSLSDAGTLDVSHNPKLVNLQANKCPNLVTVKANGLADLSVVSVKQDTTVTINNESVTTKLAELYVDHDAILNKVQGLQTLTALSVYHANDSYFTDEFEMPAEAKSTLTDLRVGNETLALASKRNNLTAVDLAGFTTVEHLETQNNPSITSLNLYGFNNKLKYINFANNHINNEGICINEISFPSLEYINCSNDSKWSTSAGNSLTDLVLTASTGIKEIYANNNDLHRITGNFYNLTNIEFAHNHINGIDLKDAAASCNEITINSEDNGRDIVADFATFKRTENNVTTVYKVYFFQLDPTYGNPSNQNHNGTLLTLKDSEDSNKNIRYLGSDGLVLGNINTWGGSNANSGVINGVHTNSVTITPDNMNVLIDPNDVPGTIVILQPTTESGNSASGTATYTYITGAGIGTDANANEREFYLNWTSDGVVTGIDNIPVIDGVSVVNTFGGLTINGVDGAVVNVYDISGRQVASETIVDGSITITGLASGIYIVNGEKVFVK